MFVQFLSNFFARLFMQEKSAYKLAASCALGAYIAFSPFVGLHTAMVFALSWLFTLNSTVTWAVSVAINNPWTMVPVYFSDYMVGDKLAQFFGFTLPASWAFLIGGNLLGLIIGVMLYPIVLRMCARFNHS